MRTTGVIGTLCVEQIGEEQPIYFGQRAGLNTQCQMLPFFTNYFTN